MLHLEYLTKHLACWWDFDLLRSLIGQTLDEKGKEGVDSLNKVGNAEVAIILQYPSIHSSYLAKINCDIKYSDKEEVASFVFKKWNTTVDKIGRQKYPPSCVSPHLCSLSPDYWSFRGCIFCRRQYGGQTRRASSGTVCSSVRRQTLYRSRVTLHCYRLDFCII